MTRVVLALIAALGVLVPSAFSSPPEAAAACVPAWVVVLTAIPTAGLAAIVEAAEPCSGPFSSSTLQCPITNVSATASDFEGNFYFAHGYQYDFVGPCGNTHVSAGYSAKTKEVAERLSGNGSVVRANWTCTGDPWIFGAGESPPTCTRISAAIDGAASQVDVQNVIDATFPMSALVLSDVSRQALKGQLGNALQQPPPPTPSKPVPAPVPATPTPIAYHVPVLVGGWPQLDLRSQGEAVRSLQYLLQAQGQPIPSFGVDGLFGPETLAGVRTFQRAQGLQVDGIVGPDTWQALLVDVQEGDQGAAVQAVQRQIWSRDGNITVDGNFGTETDGAVRDYQQSRGLTVDGDVGPQTWQSLLSGT